MAKVVQLRNIKRALRLEPSEMVNYLIGGRVNNFRTYKSVNFIDLADGSTHQHLQLVVSRDLLKKPELGAYLMCQGHITPSRGTQQSIEFKVNQVEWASKCDADRWPLASVKHNRLTDGWYRRHLHLRPQAEHFASLLRVRSELELSLHMILKQMDFFKVHTPILSSNDSEASSDLFQVQRSRQTSGVQSSSDYNEQDEEEPASDCELEETQDQAHRHIYDGYFKKDVFMLTSAQLHLESLAASLSRVYCLAPAFRAENSLSRRHLCEFTMLEAEEAHLTRLEPLLERVESIVKFAAHFVSDISEFGPDFGALLDRYSNHATFEKVARAPYIRMTYGEAMKVLRDLHTQTHSSNGGGGNGSLSALLSDLPLSACQYGHDMSRRHERHLLNYCSNVPIFITHYPRHLKPFYMKTTHDGEEALCFDLIAPTGGEICGGSLREDDPARLRETLKCLRRWRRPHLHRPWTANQDARETAGDNNQMMKLVQEFASRHKKGTEETASSSGGGDDDDDDDFQWYLDLREFGSFPHGGFGLGFERLIQSLLGIGNIRDTLAFPRWSGHCAM